MAASISTGTLFKVGNAASPEVFSTLAQVQEIKWSGYNRKTVDVYTMDSSYPTRMIGSHDPMNVELKLLFDGGIAAHEAMRTKLVAGTSGNYQIILSDAGAFQFPGLVTKFDLDAFTAEGAEVVANVTIEITALPTVTP
jgi:predicted secreted protein